MPNESKKSNHTPRAQWWFYLRVLFLTNLFLQTKQFTSITCKRVYNKTGSLLKLSETLPEPGLGDSLHRCASSHCFISTTIFGCQKQACGPHPLQLFNMAPCELVLLPWIKSQLQGHHFHNVPEAQVYSPTTPHSIPKSHLQKWQKYQTHCINLERDYKKITPVTNNKYKTFNAYWLPDVTGLTFRTVHSANNVSQCFVLISEQTATLVLHNTNWSVFITQMKSVLLRMTWDFK